MVHDTRPTLLLTVVYVLVVNLNRVCLCGGGEGGVVYIYIRMGALMCGHDCGLICACL